MADYYSILEKTISGLPNNSQLNLLEEAIVLIDSEHTVVPDPLPIIEKEPPQAELPAELAEPAVPPAPAYVAEPAPQPMPDPVSSAPEAPVTAPPVVERAIDRVESAIDQVQADMPVPDEVAQTVPQASLDDVRDVSVDPKTKDILEPIVAADNVSMPPPHVDLDEKKSGGFLGGLIKLLVILGLLGGAGLAIWKNKDELSSFASSFMSPAQVVQEEQAPEPIQTPPEPEEEVQPEEEIAETQAPEPVEPEVIEPEVAEPEIIEPEVIEPEIVEPQVIEPETTQEVAQEEVPSETQQNGVIPIGEVAYLYEEGSAGSGATRINAAITWELRQESLSAGSAPEPVIVGKMDVPEKDVSIDIVLKRNIDAAVS